LQFIYSHDINSNKLAIRVNASYIDTGVAIVADTIYKCQMQYDATADILRVYVNNSLVYTLESASATLTSSAVSCRVAVFCTIYGGSSVNAMKVGERILTYLE
jgi:hypothetical protein